MPAHQVIHESIFEFSFKDGTKEIQTGATQEDAFRLVDYGIEQDSGDFLPLEEVREQLLSVRQVCAPLKQGYFSNDPGFSSWKYAVFNTAEVENEYGRIADMDPQDRLDLCAKLTGWFARYGGVGRSFSNDPYFKVYGRKLIVKQFSALDC